MSLKLYRISQTINEDDDTFESAVVVAESEEDAKRIHPCGIEDPWETWTWCIPEEVDAEFIGIPDERFKAGDVVCASFNAG